MSTETLTVLLDQRLKERLMSLAADSDRTVDELAVQAIEEFLAVQDWQIAGVKKAIASMERGEAVPHEEVADWVGSWGTEAERPAPRR